ncbi:Aflatoxin biosynthesis regulatory protein [Penicillium cf. griseofulvum]|nr:Aflatoxin biosynthesis regulatory protein [Penicillium cf. griseofulvum]
MESTPATSLPARPKLRDSCNACSASKVKCNRDKPTCARCAKRGMACEYLVTRRAGRKHDKTRPRSNTGSSNSPQHPPLRTPEWSLSGTPNPTSNQLAGLTVDFDTFLGSPCSFPLLDPPDNLLALSNQSAQGSADRSYIEAPFIFEEEFPSLPNSSLPAAPNSADSTAITSPDNSSCSCLVKALELFRQLLPPYSATCTRAHSPRDQGLTTECIVATNAKTVDAITHMLHCLCAHDGFLLVMVFMAAFKVMNWYAAAARGLSLDSQRDDVSAGLLTEDPGRLTAQSVLSELHRVQKLVNALSAKLKRYQTEENMGDRPFSSTVLHQLELDLRQRLRELSLEIVDILRR